MQTNDALLIQKLVDSLANCVKLLELNNRELSKADAHWQAENVLKEAEREGFYAQQT